MAEPAATANVEAAPVIPYRPADSRDPGDYALVMVLALLALVAMVLAARWLQRRGALSGGDKASDTRVISQLRLGRGAVLSIVDHRGCRLAVVDSPRGVALSVLPAEAPRHD